MTSNYNYIALDDLQSFWGAEVRTERFCCHMNHHMGKPTICIGENKGADQLRSNCEADQRLCFRDSDSSYNSSPT